jgi:antitoxin component YwqK of YwqJK toxin-antitoxin module
MSIPDNLVLMYRGTGKIDTVYEEDKKGRKSGYYIEWHFTGVVYKELTYLDGKRHGRYRTWFDSGCINTDATFNNGLLHGLFRSWDKAGNLIEYAHYVNHSKEGLCKYGIKLEPRYFLNDEDITNSISYLVDDINNISEEEKTLIALQTGIVL